MTVTYLCTLLLRRWRIRCDSQISWCLRCQTWWWLKEERMRERNGGKRRDEFSLGVFYIPPELAWNQQQVAHARTSLTQPTPRGSPRPFAPRLIDHSLAPFTLLKSLSIATLKAWYKYRAMTKQRAQATARSSPLPLQLPLLPPRQQQQGSPSCRPSTGPWGVERGSFVPCEIVHERLRPKIS